jgi:hypothetical protein
VRNARDVAPSTDWPREMRDIWTQSRMAFFAYSPRRAIPLFLVPAPDLYFIIGALFIALFRVFRNSIA